MKIQQIFKLLIQLPTLLLVVDPPCLFKRVSALNEDAEIIEGGKTGKSVFFKLCCRPHVTLKIEWG